MYIYHFNVQLSRAWKKFITSGPDQNTKDSPMNKTSPLFDPQTRKCMFASTNLKLIYMYMHVISVCDLQSLQINSGACFHTTVPFSCSLAFPLRTSMRFNLVQRGLSSVKQ